MKRKKQPQGEQLIAGKAQIERLKEYCKSEHGVDQKTLLELVENESDRATVILFASAVEDRLRALLQDRMRKIESSQLQKKLFSTSGVLGTFSSLIEIAFVFGIIPQEDYSAAHLIREARNACAHCPRNIDFTTRELVDLTQVLAQYTAVKMNFKSSMLSDPKESRKFYRILFGLCVAHFMFRTQGDPNGTLQILEEIAGGPIATTGNPQQG